MPVFVFFVCSVCCVEPPVHVCEVGDMPKDTVLCLSAHWLNGVIKNTNVSLDERDVSDGRLSS